MSAFLLPRLFFSLLLSLSFQILGALSICAEEEPLSTPKQEDILMPDKTRSPSLTAPSLAPRDLPAKFHLNQYFNDSEAALPVKPVLSWRQKAAKLSLQRFNSQQAENDLLRSYALPYADALSCLASSCQMNSFLIEQANSSSGEVLAVSRDASCRLIFIVWSTEENKTWISAGIDRGTTGNSTKSAALILDTINSISLKRGNI